MDETTLKKILKWYTDAIETLKGEYEQRRTRWYVYERIRHINLLLFKLKETEYLKSLDALFIQRIDDVNKTDFEEDLTNDQI
tara:strand:- start:337 stop:582 length:246 start_codon:yes stop_codon:yes gene_type:complete